MRFQMMIDERNVSSQQFLNPVIRFQSLADCRSCLSKEWQYEMVYFNRLFRFARAFKGRAYGSHVQKCDNRRIGELNLLNMFP